MGYPIYKLLRAVNRQYPNNGFINRVDVREDMYDDYPKEMIDEDLRDLINETLQEVYIDVAIDEVYSFPTVGGQNQYVLPEDCDLRDIQEVTRTYRGIRGPLPPPPGPGPVPGGDGEPVTAYFDANGGTGTMPPIEVTVGEIVVLPECTFTPPEGKSFQYWLGDAATAMYFPGDEVTMYQDETFSAVWDEGTGHRYSLTVINSSADDDYIEVKSLPKEGELEIDRLYYGEATTFRTGTDGTLGSEYDSISVWYMGQPFIVFDMDEVLTQNVVRRIAHPVVPPEPERPGDNDDSDDDSNPLENLIVSPVDPTAGPTVLPE